MKISNSVAVVSSYSPFHLCHLFFRFFFSSRKLAAYPWHKIRSDHLSSSIALLFHQCQDSNEAKSVVLTIVTNDASPRLRSKILTMTPRPPSLCPCDPDILNTGPGYCATNCSFSDNSRAFAQALSSLVNCYQ